MPLAVKHDDSSLASFSVVLVSVFITSRVLRSAVPFLTIILRN